MKTSILKHSFCILAFLLTSIIAQAAPGNITFSPLSAKPGDVVTITGVNFAGTVALTDVFFGNTKVTAYTSASSTTLRVIVPIGATYGPITVLDKLNNRYGISRQFFSPIFSKPKGSFDANDMTVSGLFSTGANPYNVAVGDVDGDGKPDAVAVNYGANTVSVLRNTSTVGNINFAIKLDFATGLNPYSVALADIDNDTKLDIIVVNNGASTISVFKNTSTSGAISFAVKVDKATGLTGSGSTGIAVADIDSDGWQDVLVCNGGNNKVSFLQNTSTTTAINFATKIEYTTGTTPRGIAIGDIDGDAKLDIIVTNAGASSISIIRNTMTIAGSLTLAAKVDYSVGLDPVSVALGDITADGKLDVIVSNYSATNISTLRNNSVSGTITLIAAVNKSAIPFPETVAITDIDADGKADVMFASNASSFAVLKNTTTATTPTYAASVDFGTGSLTYAHAMGDIDGDGKIDAVVVTNFNNAIVVVRNAPVYSTNANLSALTTTAGTISPTFSSSTTSYTASVAVATTSIIVTPTKQQDSAKLEIQLNGGAYTSIASGSPSSALTLNLGLNTINIRVTAQDGTTIKIYTLTVNRAAPPTITSISPTSGAVGTTVTITGTFFSSTPANNVVFFGATKATVTAATTTSLTVTVPASATYAPITILNTASVLTASSKQYFNTTYKPNKGSITNIDMTASANFTVNSDPQQVAVGDIDGDGRVDAVVVDYGNSKVSVLLNTSTSGTVSFATKVDFTTTTRPYSVALADINNDGKLDIITADFLSATISVFRNTSTSGIVSFATRVDKSSGIALATHQFLAVADIDGDGKLDVVVANGGTNDISVLRNTSTTTTIAFATFVTFSTVTGPSGIAVGDIDNDGKPDVVVSGETNLINGKISILRNTSVSGTINFATKANSLVGGGCSFVTLGDMNGDGLNDIITGNTSGNSVSILVNYSVAGTLFIDPVRDFATGTNGSIVSIADVDGDGKLDIAVAGNAGGGVIVLRNTTIASWNLLFEPYIVFASAPSSKGVACADIDGDGKVDITAISFLSTNLVVLRNTPVLSNDNNLKVLSATAGALVPVFDSLTLNYNINVRNFVTSTTVTATKKQDSAKIEMQFNGGGYTSFVSGSTSSSLPLSIGINTINFRVTAQNGNVKIYTITITRACLAPSSTTNLAVCPSQLPYTWNTLVFTGAGTQGIILTNTNGCDSTANLILKLKSTSTSTTTLSACDSLVWNGTTYKKSGSYFYHTLNSVGCDSTATLNLIIKKPTTSWTDVVTCDSTFWNGIWYSKSGFYTVHFTNKAGCDSAASLNLTVKEKPTGTFTTTSTGGFCAGDSTYISFDVPFTRNRQYLRIYAPIDTTFEIGTASFGADTRTTPLSANSIVYLPNSSPSNQACSTTFATNLFDGRVALIDRGNCTFASKAKAVQNAGAIGIIIVNNIAGDGANGMIGTDTTITIPVISVSLEDGQIIKNWLNSGTNVVPYSVVHTPTYLWSTGSTSNTIKAKPLQTTVYNVTVSYENGCSQIFYYAQIVAQKSTSWTDVVACDSTVWNGVTYKASGLYIYHTLNSVGCDSAATLNLTIKKSTSSWTDILACDSAFYNGTTYKTNGQYIFHTINTAGCDSTSVLNVTLKKSTSSTTTLSVCDSIVWNGVKYKQSGLYTYKTNNVVGCDSTATLNLTIKTKTSSTTNLSICPSALPYVWNGLTFTAVGSKTKTGLVNSQNCDSSATLNLSIKTNTYSTTDTTICSNLLPFIWNGATFISSATFNKPGFINSQGCDSSAILNLTVKTTTASTTNLSICPSQLPYSWNGLTFTAAGSKTKTGLTNSQVCDSSATLNLIVSAAPLTNALNFSGCQQVIYKGKTYLSSSTFIDTAKNSLGCDSIYYTVYITVRNTTPTTQTQNLVGCKKIIFNGKTYVTSSIVRDTVRTNFNCDSIYKITNITINTNCVYYVNTTFTVSMTNYLRTGNTIDTGGIRIAGNFADLGINLPNWTPTSPLCKLTRIGSSDDWSISIPIPDTSINKTLLFKFVNTNWGKNEGIDFGSELRNSTLCSVSDGGGNYNRFLVLPTNDSSVNYCWERCSSCNTTENAPTVTTGSITATTPNKVTVSNNNLIATGGLTVTQKGLLVSTHPNPNIYNNSFNSYFHYINPSLGTYSVFIGGLYSNTQYYARAYASNAIGTTYGSIIPFVLCDTAKKDTLNLTGCGNVIYNGNTYASSTIKNDTLKTTLGCDSIYRVTNITVKPTSASYHSATVCANALPYTWNGNTYNAAGNYTAHFTNAIGCDSTVNFKLIVNVLPVISLNSSSNCLNTSNLNLTGASNALQIVWQKNGLTVNTTMPTVAAFGTTVAGGNPTSTLPNALNGPSSVFVDKSGVLYVGDLNNARIQRFAVGNLNATTVAGSGTIGLGLHQFNSPSGVMVNDSNNVYVGDFGNHRVTKWLSNATTGIVVAGGNGSTNTSNAFNGVADIFLDAANNVYVADQNNHRIQKWTPGATSGVTVAGGNGAGSNANQINLPTAVFVDAIGNVYVGDYGNKRVTKWTVGATNGITVAGGNGAGAANNQIDLLAGLFVDAIGNVYVADQNNHRIQRWAVGATTGVTVAGGNGAGSNANQFKYPKDVFIDTMGALYVPDNWNQRVQKFTSSINSTYLPNTSGNYTAIVTNNAGCTTTSNVVSIVSNVTPTIGISANKTNVCAATKVRFNATINNGGSSPVYQWKRNGINVGNNSNNYLDSSFNAIDSVWCVLTSNATCTTNPVAKSNIIQLLATQAPAQQNINLQGCSSVTYNGNSYFNSTIVNDTLKTVDGCDSIFKLININITNPSTPTNTITSNFNNICFGTKTTFTATSANQGTSPSFKWYKNGMIVSTNSNLYQDSLLKNQDSIWCILTSSDTCVTANNIKSNVIKMSVSLAITGSIKTPIGNFVSNVVLNRNGTKNDAQIVSKKYNSSCIDYSDNINLRPNKNNDITKANGINSTDVLFVQRHILNTTKLTSAYKLIAADVNGDKVVNTTDVLRIKRLILGTDTTFTKGSGVNKVNRLWEFVDSAYQFPDTTNPFPFKDSISFTNLTSNKINQTFIGVKLGDVNYDWNPAVAKGVEAKPVEFVYTVRNEELGIGNSVLRIPITANNFKELVAMQYTLHFNNKDYEFVGIENNKLDIDFNSKQATSNGNISFLWTDKNAVERSLEDGTEIFVLVLKQKGTGNLELGISDAITDIAAWDKDYNQHNIILSKREKLQTPNIEQWSVSPNPTNGEIKVSLVSKVNKTIVFELSDAQGKAIVKQVVELQKGNNNFTMNLKKNGNITTGIYFLKAVGMECENVLRVYLK
jgi:hypothetical protein